MDYALEINRIVDEINTKKHRNICVQLPDGLKPRAAEIQDEIIKKTDAKVFIWLGSCFGACDLPLHLKDKGIDLLVHFGHSEWK